MERGRAGSSDEERRSSFARRAWFALATLALVVALTTIALRFARRLEERCRGTIDRSSADGRPRRDESLVAAIAAGGEAERAFLRGLGATDLDLRSQRYALYAEVYRRGGLGFVAIRPTNWYLYYVRGERVFHHFVSRSWVATARCPPDSITCVALRATRRSGEVDERDDRAARRRLPRIVCLNGSVELIASTFASVRPRVVSLDDAISKRRDSRPFTIVSALNRLMSDGAL